MESESRPIIQACYINGEICRNGKRDDFKIDPQTGEKYHCNKWVLLRGADPQTGHPIDTWCCNEFAKIKLMMENAQMVRQGKASTDKVANEVARHHGTFLAAMPDELRDRVIRANPRLVLKSDPVKISSPDPENSKEAHHG
jgi:hypothetical protein